MNNHQVNIMEITQKLADSAHLQNDMREAAALVTGMFKERYISRINESFEKLKEQSAVNPPKEVVLLRALLPFMPEGSRYQMDKMAEMLILFDTFAKMQNPQNMYPDGVYEVDMDCVNGRSG